MVETVKAALVGQMEGALCMLNDCVQKCPDELWDAPIGKYPFWQVAYHTLCYADLYLSVQTKAWEADRRPDGLHPKGRAEMMEERPSRRFERAELMRYAALCAAKARERIGAETGKTLAGPSGFSWLKMTRVEAHIYNVRHVEHHVGQLSAALRRVGERPVWVWRGWRKTRGKRRSAT